MHNAKRRKGKGREGKRKPRGPGCSRGPDARNVGNGSLNTQIQEGASVVRSSLSLNGWTNGGTGPMHHSLTRHRNFSVLSNYLGITANESNPGDPRGLLPRGSFARVQTPPQPPSTTYISIHLYKDIYVHIHAPVYTRTRTHTGTGLYMWTLHRGGGTSASSQIARCAFSSVCDQGTRRIAFQQLLNTPVRKRRSSLRTIGERGPFLVECYLRIHPPLPGRS